MMKTPLLFLVIVLLLSSCDKEKSISKKLTGEWELTLFKITLQNGLSQYPESSGNLKIVESDGEVDNSFQSQMSFDLSGNPETETKTGTIQLRDNGNYMNVSILDANNVQIGTEDHRIMVLTKTDLQLEFADEFGRLRNLTFRKK